MHLTLKRVIVVGLCVCVFVHPSVCPSFFSITAAALSVKRGHVMK